MGARLGLNVQINSKFCADLSLLEIGDGAVIGGHATVIAHSFESHGLILKRVRIGHQAIIGLNAIVLPGARIGERAVIGAGVFVPKDTVVPSGTAYLGNRAT
jgi:acetyltransferase-like isoleucine patch superfamily enzyme